MRIFGVVLLSLFAGSVFADEASEREVILAALAFHFEKPQPFFSDAMLLVDSKTLPIAANDPVRNDRRIDQTMRDDYVNRNATPIGLQSLPPQFLPPADLTSLFDGAEYDWKKVSSAHPSARVIVEFARPGFSPDGNKAVVQFAMTGPLRTTRVHNVYVMHRDESGSWRFQSGRGGATAAREMK